MTAEPPPQNIYDDPAFFAGYSRLERFGPGWTRALEHPSFMALLPDVAGRRVLDLGCGVGQLAHHLAERGAAEVIGVDISERMLALARAERSHPRLRYLRMAIEQAAFGPRGFDLVVSSLAIHYVADYHGLVQRIACWLSPGGILVYSTEHPVYLTRACSEGWEHWFTDGVQKYHRTLSSLLNGLIDAGLAIERVVEPVPDEQQIARHPEWIHERRRPFCLVVRARKQVKSP